MPLKCYILKGTIKYRDEGLPGIWINTYHGHSYSLNAAKVHAVKTWCAEAGIEPNQQISPPKIKTKYAKLTCAMGGW